MSQAQKVVLPVKVQEVTSYGSIEHIYVPQCDKGRKLLQQAIAMSRKPDSKRQSFSTAMVKNSIATCQAAGIAIEFKCTEYQELKKPTKVKVGDVLFQETAIATAMPDLGFLA